MYRNVLLEHAYSLNSPDADKEIPPKDIHEGNLPHSHNWLHFRIETEDKDIQGDGFFNDIKKHLNIDDVICEALLADGTRPRTAEFDDGLVIILRGANLNKDADPEDMISIRIFVSKNNIISVVKRGLSSIDDMQAKIRKNEGPKNTGQFLVSLIDHLCDKMEPSLKELSYDIDEIEEEMMLNPDADKRSEILEARGTAIMFKRYLTPQQDAINQLLHGNHQSFLSDKEKKLLSETLDRFIRFVEDIEVNKERCYILQDELTNHLSININRNMYVLSVIAGIFLPITFLTGLMGMNVGGLPWASSDFGFVLFLSVLFVVVSIELYLFKKLKFF